MTKCPCGIIFKAYDDATDELCPVCQLDKVRPSFEDFKKQFIKYIVLEDNDQFKTCGMEYDIESILKYLYEKKSKLIDRNL